MVHISDGVLSFQVITVGWVITFILIGIALWLSKKEGKLIEEIPKVSVITAAFFVASLIHVPVGPTSVHLILNGLVGVMLGVLSFPAIFIGITLQALLFQHGGITTIGINSVLMGVPALIAFGIFRVGIRLTFLGKDSLEVLFGAIAGGLAVIFSVIILAISLVTTGEEFLEIAGIMAFSHIPIVIIEAVVVGFVVAFLVKVKPELLPIDREDSST